MVQSLLLASSLLLPGALAAGLYAKQGPVLNLDAQTYNTLIAKSNHSSIVEFYAPWCGHCQSLKPAYEKAAKSLSGLAKVAAINCDDEENKPFCGSMGVQGFPTLKIVRPNTKKAGGRPMVEDYQGPRTAKAIVDAMIEKIPNHVTRLKEGDVSTWTALPGHKAILFSDKGTVSALLRSLAIDYLGVVSFGQVRDKEVGVVNQYKVEKFPTLLLLPEDGSEPLSYTGEMKRDGILSFLKTVAQPNPETPAKKAKASKTDKAKASKNSSAYSAAASSHASSQAAPTQQAETIVDDGNPMPSPGPEVDGEKPIKVPTIAEIPTLKEGLTLQHKCLNEKSGTCILLLLPELHPENPYPKEAITSLSEIQAKHSGRKLFPFYQTPVTNSQAGALRKLLKLDDGVEIIAINAKKKWFRRYEKPDFLQNLVEGWIDEIRLGEGTKQTLPDAAIADSSMLADEPTILSADDAQKMADNLKSQLPDGVEMEFEEIDDAAYERLMNAAKESKVEKTHDEL